MTPTDRVDPGFAPWSLMTPDPAKARVTGANTNKIHGDPGMAVVHEDKRAPSVTAKEGYMFGEDGLTFGDVLDAVNPLQHLPVVGAVYRSITNDQIDPGASLAGGIIYGGPIGLASAAINNAIEEHSGNDIAGHALSFLGFGDDDPAVADEGLDVPVATASASPQPRAQDDEAVINLSAQQAAALQAFAARASGAQLDTGIPGAITPPPTNTASPLSQPASSTIDDVVAQASVAPGNAAAGNTQRRDFGGVARVSDEMAKHLAHLAQSETSPAETLAHRAVSGENRAGGLGERAARQPVQPFIGGPMPLTVHGDAPVANPFIGLAARPRVEQPLPPKPDPFDVALEQLGLRNPVPADVLSPIATTAQAAPETTPSIPDGGIPAAMLSALQRYETMKQEG